MKKILFTLFSLVTLISLCACKPVSNEVELIDEDKIEIVNDGTGKCGEWYETEDGECLEGIPYNYEPEYGMYD